MITERELHEAIAECQGQRNPNANTCMKLASYYTILDHIREVQTYSFDTEPTEQVRYNSGSEFSDLVRGKDYAQVLSVMDELMETISLLIPKLYRATMEKLRDL